MSDKRYNDTPVDSIPEVRAFEDVKARYQAFREANPAYFNILDSLMTEFNEKLEAAEKTCRAKSISCGSFAFYQQATKIDADRMHDVLGRERFLAMGGGVKVIEQKEFDRARVEANVKSGNIKPDEAKEFIRNEPRYHKPEKVNLP